MTDSHDGEQGLQEAAEYLFGRHCRVRREQLGMSQEQVASKMRRRWIMWHQTVVAKVESGQRAVKLTEAYALASVLDMRLDDLTLGNDLPISYEVVHGLDHEGEETVGVRERSE